MKIYTKTGDSGETALFAGPRVPKDNARIEAFGTVDELNAVLGIVATMGLGERHAEMVQQIQHELFSLGAELATPAPDRTASTIIDTHNIDRLEKWIDELSEDLPPLQEFILPGGSPAAAFVHQARTVCRRGERRVTTLSRLETSADVKVCLIYLNRLGDLLFVLARAVNFELGQPDVTWKKPQ